MIKGKLACLLSVLSLLMLLPSRADAQQESTTEISRLSILADQAVKAGDLAKAVALVEQMVAIAEPEHVEALYSAAQLHARLGNREKAYLYLSRAVGAGFNDRARLLQEEAFKEYRGEDLFKSLARRAWARGYTDLLERPNREDVQKAPEIMKALAFKPGERVADIGAGSGYFTIPVARAVGPTGIVWALDIAPEMLEFLDLRVKAQKIDNIKLRRVASDDPQIPPASVDTILMIDTIHYVKDRTAYRSGCWRHCRRAVASSSSTTSRSRCPRGRGGRRPNNSFRDSNWTTRWPQPASRCCMPTISCPSSSS